MASRRRASRAISSGCMASDMVAIECMWGDVTILYNGTNRGGFRVKSRDFYHPDVKLIDQALLQSVVGQFGVVLQVHLLQQTCAIDADRLHTEAQLLADLRQGFA